MTCFLIKKSIFMSFLKKIFFQYSQDEMGEFEDADRGVYPPTRRSMQRGNDPAATIAIPTYEN